MPAIALRVGAPPRGRQGRVPPEDLGKLRPLALRRVQPEQLGHLWGAADQVWGAASGCACDLGRKSSVHLQAHQIADRPCQAEQ